MKNIICFTLALPLLLVTPAAISGCAGSQSVGEAIDDTAIKTRVGRALVANPDVSRYQIDVDVMDAVVTLRGEVADQATADMAVQIAENTEGVQRVVNQLQIEGEASPEDQATAAEGNDVGIQTAVASRIAAAPDVSVFNIDVDVVEGVVYLSGVVDTENAKMTAERIAQGVENVVRVQNDLQVQGGTQEPQEGMGEGEAQGEAEPGESQ